MRSEPVGASWSRVFGAATGTIGGGLHRNSCLRFWLGWRMCDKYLISTNAVLFVITDKSNFVELIADTYVVLLADKET